MVCVQVCCQIDVGVIVVDASVKGGARAPHEINGVHTGQRRHVVRIQAMPTKWGD
jgi:hypothetical protein